MRWSRVLYVGLLYLYAATLQYDRFVSHNNPGLPYLPQWATAFSTFVGWVLLLGLAGLLVIVDATRNALRRDETRLLRPMRWFKLALVPFFLWVIYSVSGVVLAFGMYGAVGFLAAVFPENADMAPLLLVVGGLASFAGWLVVAITFALAYAVFLPTSADGIAYLILLRRERRIDVAALVGYVVMLLVPVVDLLSTLIVSRTYGLKPASGADSAAAGTVEAPA